jgi:Cytochrome c554 and c-prime
VAGKFKIRSPKWDIGIAIGAAALLVLGFGGLALLRGDGSFNRTPVNVFVILLGIITFAFFAGPGIVYVARKRIPSIKKVLPGGTMAWIRSHLYLPVLALVAAFVHGSVVPFREVVTSGKVLLLLGVLVAIAGWFRHHLIGIQKAALNVDVAISKITVGQPRAFRRLVADYTENRRSAAEVDAAMASSDPSLQQRWHKIKELRAPVERHFPRSGRQSTHIRHYKLWKAIHAPLTIALFAVLAFHVWDVLGGTLAAFGDEADEFASSAQCSDCHSEVFTEWQSSTMAHAQTSTITEAQLPVTLFRNSEIAEELGGDQEDVFDDTAKVCINCHSQVGARFAEDDTALYPLSDEGSRSVDPEDDGIAVEVGGDAVHTDGVGCIVCHTQESPPAELAGAAEMAIDNGGADDFGDLYGPLLEDPGALPARVHSLGSEGLWEDRLRSGELCGACHNVKADVDGDGELSDFEGADDGGIDDDEDEDGDFQLDQNELDDSDDDGQLDDLVLQTTFDEWQDYIFGYEDRIADAEDEFTNVADPLPCTECHMPTEGEGTGPIVDHGPGLLPRPDRDRRSHTFVGVDYDLDPAAYDKEGLPDDALERVLAEREALLRTSVRLEVRQAEPDEIDRSFNGQVDNFEAVDVDSEGTDIAVNDEDALDGFLTVSVEVHNNLLAHAFPTGFAFARQFWLEVSAETDDGDEVCLADPDPALPSPCTSGDIDDAAEDLPQCDLAAVAEAVGVDPLDLPNGNIAFAEGATFPVGECDPWLTNFQKILTDGDLDEDGVFEEIPYQPFRGNAVQLRQRLVNGQTMFELQPVRLRQGVDDAGNEAFFDQSLNNYVYDFDVSEFEAGTEIEVTVRLRFRHLPPYFVRALEAEQEDLGDVVPAGARIDADELLDEMVVTDVADARSGDGEVTACPGPQNEAGRSVFECLPDGGLTVGGEEGRGAGPTTAAAAGLADGGWLLWFILDALVIGNRSSVRRVRGILHSRRSGDRIQVLRASSFTRRCRGEPRRRVRGAG